MSKPSVINQNIDNNAFLSQLLQQNQMLMNCILERKNNFKMSVRVGPIMSDFHCTLPTFSDNESYAVASE